MNTVITGATKGIGRAIAVLFAQNGHNLAICSRNQQELNDFKVELERNYAIKVLTRAVDVSKKNQIESFANDILEQWSKIDVLINNAGVFISGKISEEPDGVLEAMMDTNLYSAYHLTRALLPKFLMQADGHIFNLCSIASKTAYPNGGSYSISKFALLGFNKVLREELKDKGIRVTAIMPGATWSDSWAGVELPYERLMPAEDIAKTIWAAYELSKVSVVEDITIRPLLGDL